MVVTQGSTAETIRVSVGRNLNAVKLITAAANGSTTTFLTDDLEGTSTTEHTGKKWRGTDSPNDEVQARVISSTVSSSQTTLTLHPAVTSTLSGDTAELWDEKFDPKDIRDYMNQAIREVTALAYDPEENDGTQDGIGRHGDVRTSRFPIQTEFAMLNQVEFRRLRQGHITIDAATEAWDESVDTDVTASADTKDFKRGASFKMVVTASVAAGDILATNAIGALDISGMSHAEFWIKSTVATSAAGLQLLLDDTASCASPLETLDVPALTADTWAYIRVALANPELDTAIISVGLKYTVDIGAVTLWLNDVKAIQRDSEEWSILPKQNWSIDREARALVLTPVGIQAVGYSLMKFIGGDKPALFTADSTVCEVNDWYVICRATALALRAKGGGTGVDVDDSRRRAEDWERLAQQAKATHHLPANVRKIS